MAIPEYVETILGMNADEVGSYVYGTEDWTPDRPHDWAWESWSFLPCRSHRVAYILVAVESPYKDIWRRCRA